MPNPQQKNDNETAPGTGTTPGVDILTSGSGRNIVMGFIALAVVVVLAFIFGRR